MGAEPLATPRRRRRLFWLSAAALVVLLVIAYRKGLGGSPPELPLARATQGDFVERIDLRGEIRPVKSVILAAPRQAGELVIVQLVKSGTMVAAGDVIATFDPVTLRQNIQDKKSELRQTEAEIDRARANVRIAREQNQTAMLKARYDVERSRLSLGDEKLTARMEYEKAKLTLVNAEQRLLEMQQKLEASGMAAAADVASRERQRDKAQDELTRLEQALQAMDLVAPAAGTVHLLTNGRAASPMGAAPEFREGDRLWAGAQIAELPDLSSVFLRATVDEDSRGRLQTGQAAQVRLDAIPDRELRATVAEISVLARVEMGSGFPPPRNFELKISVDESDSRLRPGMSATARVEVDRLKDALLLPAGAVFNVNGRSVVYRLEGSTFHEVPIVIARRSKEQVAVASGVAEGDQIALEQPLAADVRRSAAAGRAGAP